MREFNVGDKVKCIDAIGSINRELKNGETYIVSHVDTNGFVKLKGLSSYYYDPSRFKKIEYTYEDLKKSSIGTKLIFENGRVLVKFDNDGYKHKTCFRENSDLIKLEDKLGTLGKIIKIEEPTYTTVFEAKKEILDEAEKRYLKEVIRLYRKVKSILKYVYPGERIASIIIIVLDLDNEAWTFTLPPFEKNKMYKNMEDNKNYTLEELGL